MMPSMIRRWFIKGISTTVLLAALALGLVLLGVFPVRAYVDQQRDLSASSSRLEMLARRNAELSARIEVLKSDKEVARLAREQFGMVRQGEKLVLISGLRPEDSGFRERGSDSATIRPAPPAPPERQSTIVRILVDAVSFWR